MLMRFTSWFGICNKHTSYVYEIVVWWVLVTWGGGGEGGTVENQYHNERPGEMLLRQIGLISIALALQRDHVSGIQKPPKSLYSCQRRSNTWGVCALQNLGISTFSAFKMLQIFESCSTWALEDFGLKILKTRVLGALSLDSRARNS